MLNSFHFRYGPLIIDFFSFLWLAHTKHTNSLINEKKRFFFRLNSCGFFFQFILWFPGSVKTCVVYYKNGLMRMGIVYITKYPFFSFCVSIFYFVNLFECVCVFFLSHPFSPQDTEREKGPGSFLFVRLFCCLPPHDCYNCLIIIWIIN